MRNAVFLFVLAVLGLFACGPSSKELASAKMAHYKGDKLAMFNAAKEATAAKYDIAKSDEGTLGFETRGRWYTAEGLSATVRGDDMRDVPDKSINVVLVVTMVPDGDAYVVRVKPVMMRRLADSPLPQKLTEDDPSVPGWAHGKVDQLQFAIHDALKQYEVQSVPAVVPAGPGAAPSPDEGAGSAAAPAETTGSAASPAPAPAQ